MMMIVVACRIKIEMYEGTYRINFGNGLWSRLADGCCFLHA